MPADHGAQRLVAASAAEDIARGTTVPVLLRRPVQAPKAAAALVACAEHDRVEANRGG